MRTMNKYFVIDPAVFTLEEVLRLLLMGRNLAIRKSFWFS